VKNHLPVEQYPLYEAITADNIIQQELPDCPTVLLTIPIDPMEQDHPKFPAVLM
jgi:hypothetical protein